MNGGCWDGKFRMIRGGMFRSNLNILKIFPMNEWGVLRQVLSVNTGVVSRSNLNIPKTF